MVLLGVLVGCGRVGFGDFDGNVGSDATDARIDASFTARHWVNRASNAPGLLYAPKLVYHSIRRTVILYGGGGGQTPNIVSDEMWEWDGTTWTRLCTGSCPTNAAPRVHAPPDDARCCPVSDRRSDTLSERRTIAMATVRIDMHDVLARIVEHGLAWRHVDRLIPSSSIPRFAP